jgi:methanogenic corrinoid protein MtbC1/DNA-binding XRE family transcriptional regulator
MNSFRPLKTRAERKHDLAPIQLAYARALTEGNTEVSSSVLEELLSRNPSLAEIYSQVVAPSLVTIGDLWCNKDISVAEEHLATQVVLNHLDRLSSMFAWRDRRLSYRVLVACVEGERHWLGARMFADLSLSYGWSVEFLGPDVPDDSLIEIVKKRAPNVVALSATMAQGAEHARHVVSELSKLAHSPRMILGGHAVLNPSHRSWDGACVVRDVIDGAETALKFLRANRPKAILKEYLLALGRRVRDLRLKKGWTQEQLAEGARVTRVCIVAVEGGKQNVSMDVVIRLANALGVAPQGLMSDDAEPAQIVGRNP